MVAFKYRMPAGIPGSVTRTEHATIEPGIVDAAGTPAAFGSFVKVVAGKVRAIAADDTAAVVYGLLVRSFPTQASQDGLGASTPPAGSGSVMRRGYMTVLLTQGSAARNSPVHLRVVAAAGKAIGDIEAVADGTNSFVVPGAVFMGPADAGGNVEIAFNI